MKESDVIVVATKDDHLGIVLGHEPSYPADMDSLLRRWQFPMENGLILEIHGYQYADRVEITSIGMFS